jgi:hypothetical protein
LPFGVIIYIGFHLRFDFGSSPGIVVIWVAFGALLKIYWQFDTLNPFSSSKSPI